MIEQNINLARTLAKGVAGWLQFEHACHRASIFSEKYLSVPISQILNTHYGAGVHAEIKHPILGEQSPGRGRPPELDFAVFDNDRKLRVAIESKWVGGAITKQTIERILWDLLRLAMIGNTDEVRCYFLLGGKKKQLEKLFQSKHFLGEIDRHGRHRPILKVKPDDKPDYRIDSPKEDRLELLKPILLLCQAIELPTRLATGEVYCFPKDALQYDYQVYVWEVMPNRQKMVFRPCEHKHYKK